MHLQRVVGRQVRLQLLVFWPRPAPPQTADDDVEPEHPREHPSCCEEGAIDQHPAPRAARLPLLLGRTGWLDPG